MQKNMPDIIGHNGLININDQRKVRNSYRTSGREEVNISLPENVIRRQNTGRNKNENPTQYLLQENKKSYHSSLPEENRDKMYTSPKKSDYVEKKYGIKTLLQTKSKFVYPFNNLDTMSISEKAIDNIEKYKKCLKETDHSETETFIESMILDSSRKTESKIISGTENGIPEEIPIETVVEPVIQPQTYPYADDDKFYQFIDKKYIISEEEKPTLTETVVKPEISDEKDTEIEIPTRIEQNIDDELINDIKNRTDNIINMDDQNSITPEIKVEQDKIDDNQSSAVQCDEPKGYIPRRFKKNVPESNVEKQTLSHVDEVVLPNPVVKESDERPNILARKSSRSFFSVPEISEYSIPERSENVNIAKGEDIPVDKQNILKKRTTESDVDPQAQLLISRRNVESMCIKNVAEEFPSLTLDDISISLKVVGDLPTTDTNTKLIVVNLTHLAIDTSLFQSISRYGAGQGRELIFNFLEHMYSELENNINILLADIDAEIKINENILIIRGIICKLAVFLHKYENMRSVYKTDSSMFAKLGNNRDKFHSLMTNFFRKVILNNK